MSYLLMLLSLTACAKRGSLADEQFDTQSREAGRLNETKTADGLVEQSIDINMDGRPDVFNYYRETTSDAPRRLVRKETDLNMDGHVDGSSITPTCSGPSTAGWTGLTTTRAQSA